MRFSEVVEQVIALLQRQGRVSYRALKREFDLDNEYLEDLKAEIIKAKRLAVDEDGEVLVWVGAAPVSSSTFQVSSSSQSPTPNTQHLSGERRQLTVMFIDLVGSTMLSQQLDPEEYHARVHAYQTACSQITVRYEGYVAQYLGDGVLVYFGYPAAHEDDAGRAVRSGLEIVAAVSQLQFTPPLQIRIGIHTGPVVVAEIGAGVHTEQLALGETPNLAARVQGQAAPNAVVISASTERLVRGLFECRDLGRQEVKGVTTPLALAQVMQESAARSRFEAATHAGLTPLVGREHEIAMLLERWQLAQDGEGQVVLLSSEPGIGKSRILSALWERLEGRGAQALRLQSSPYYVNSALYPIIDNFERTLKFGRDETAESKLDKLEALLVTHYGRPQQDVRFIAVMLSIPCEERYGAIAMTPQKHKEETLRALVDLVEAAAHQQPTVMLFEDAHWADPTSLEMLDLLIDRVRNVPLLIVLTHRPEFPARWSRHSQVTALNLSKLTRAQSNAIVAKLTSGKALPAELLGQILAKTDGVPLFVEELTKTVLESVASSGSIASIGSVIPATLQDALMARLDRLGPAKEVAQMGATLGREFSYELLYAVSPKEETHLQQALAKLVEAEVLYQRGASPQTRYLFKHALIQDVAYQSLLKSTRQQYHSQIATVMEEQLAETKETQPELLAHHYTEASLLEQAIPYWQQAGQRAIERSAHTEAISHLTKGLDLLKALPDTPEHLQKELLLQTALGPALIATKGQAAADVAKVYTRARELCEQLGETPQLFPVILGLRRFYLVQAELQTARKLGEQLLSLAQNVQDSSLLLEAHGALGLPLFWLGELTTARAHLEQGITLYDPQQHSSHVFLYGQDPGVLCRLYVAFTLWHLGYPDQALKRINEALTLAQEISHPYSLAFALFIAAWVHQYRREEYAVQQRVEEMMRLCHEHGFPFWLAEGMILQGWVLIEQGKYEEGVGQIHQGVAAHRDTGVKLARPYFLAVLAEAYGKVGQGEEALAVLTEALAMVRHKGERMWEAELDRLKGELMLTQSRVQRRESRVQKEAEECFQKAIEIARQQQAKSLELRAAMSLSRLWQQQGKKTEAHQMLANIYNWFTEGFDTKDLQEAKALLHELV